MGIHLRRPSVHHLQRLVDAGRDDALTYAPPGITSAGEVPAGFRRDRWERELGSGDDTFQAAAEAIRAWQVHRGAGLLVCADGPPSVDQVVAMSAPLPVGFVDVVCRVITVIDEPGRSGFAYGTLPVHPECGEESFVVVRRPGGSVVFEVDAISRPRHVLARLAPPIARRLQEAASRRYGDSMCRAVAGAHR